MVDRTRKFTLPRIQDLSKEQEAAIALPLEGQHLIIGGPGTGKSIVALLRAQRLARKKRTYWFLVYNRLLNQSNMHLFGGDVTLTAETWDGWLRWQWGRLTQTKIPTLQPKPPSSYRQIDWDTLEGAVDKLPHDVQVTDPPFLVIDEGQDMPPTFYRTLVAMGFRNFYVVADQNQQIHPDQCSSRQDIEDALALDPQSTIELKYNYRNTYSTARLARAFYAGDPASPPPELPRQPESPSTDMPLLVTYGDGTPWSLESILNRVLQICDRNPRKLVGIITPNNDVRARFMNGLAQAQPRLDHDKAPVRTYASGQQNPLDFGQGGIMVINAQSCKGLEFDIAFLADIDQHWALDEYALRSRFYVMVARAREEVNLLRNGDPAPEVEAILPEDPTILKRG